MISRSSTLLCNSREKIYYLAFSLFTIFKKGAKLCLVPAGTLVLQPSIFCIWPSTKQMQIYDNDVLKIINEMPIHVIYFYLKVVIGLHSN